MASAVVCWFMPESYVDILCDTKCREYSVFGQLGDGQGNVDAWLKSRWLPPSVAHQRLVWVVGGVVSIPYQNKLVLCA
jgi:hypothetical protein